MVVYYKLFGITKFDFSCRTNCSNTFTELSSYFRTKSAVKMMEAHDSSMIIMMALFWHLVWVIINSIDFYIKSPLGLIQYLTHIHIVWKANKFHMVDILGDYYPILRGQFSLSLTLRMRKRLGKKWLTVSPHIHPEIVCISGKRKHTELYYPPSLFHVYIDEGERKKRKRVKVCNSLSQQILSKFRKFCESKIEWANDPSYRRCWRCSMNRWNECNMLERIFHGTTTVQ